MGIFATMTLDVLVSIPTHFFLLIWSYRIHRLEWDKADCRPIPDPVPAFRENPECFIPDPTYRIIPDPYPRYLPNHSGSGHSTLRRKKCPSVWAMKQISENCQDFKNCCGSGINFRIHYSTSYMVLDTAPDPVSDPKWIFYNIFTMNVASCKCVRLHVKMRNKLFLNKGI